MWHAAEQFLWSAVLAAPLILLSLGFAAFLRLAVRRPTNIVHLPKRKGSPGRAS